MTRRKQVAVAEPPTLLLPGVVVLDPKTGLPPECRGAHKTGPIIWPGTAHQHVVCERCRRRLPV